MSDSSLPPIVVYIALGTNLGERLDNLASARAALPPEIELLRASPIYETDPWGYLDQPAYLNQVIETRTNLPPLQLLKYLKQIEQGMGRKPTFQNGPRLIDLDILFYGQVILDSPTLRIPHPRLAERAFVLVPLADLVPGLRHPITGKTIHDLLRSLDTSGVHPFQV